MLVRRQVWEALGGFHEGVRSGADVEFCWRVQDAGWTLEHRPDAVVEHRYRRRLRTLVGQSARHAAGRRWVVRRYAGAFEAPSLIREVTRSLAGAVVWPLALQPRRGLHKLIDGIVAGAGAWGWWFGSNEVRPAAERLVRASEPRSLVMITDAFPARSETFVYNEMLALTRHGWRLRVESLARPARVERSVARALTINYLEDDAPRNKFRDLVWLGARHPIRCFRDLRDRRRWRREEAVWPLAAIAPAARRLARGNERHLHAHFAAGGALQALRLSRLLGIPYGVTAHAYDIFQRPRNLAEKLSRASFAAAECDYAADALRSAVGPAVADRVHRIATGTDAQRFRRRDPTPDDGRVLAIGRLVEKKGFAHLIRAAALLRDDPRISQVTIAGEGPLATELKTLAVELGLGDFVRLRGALWGPDAVRDLLEGADLLAIPSVIASDGDRDALPLVTYEALAMEVPVVASRLVGLPELVRPPWGRLTTPGDHTELAEAIRGFLAAPVSERRDAAALGREFVVAGFDPEQEVRKLAALHLAA
jgi:glycosyltransferase involved in cell wall biosynthesis